MNNLEKYLDQVVEQKPVVYEPPAEMPQEAQTVDVLGGVRRRWYVVAAVMIVICALVLPAIWLLVEPQYVVTGAVRVAPMVSGILNPEGDRGEIASYGEFVNTQAILLMSSGTTLQAIADDLGDRNLGFFSGQPQTRLEKLLAMIVPTAGPVDPEAVLRDAIAEKKITAGHLPRTELLSVTLTGNNLDEAKIIVDSFLRNYVARYGTERAQDENKALTSLERRQNELLTRILDQRKNIRALADEFGTEMLDPRQEMEMSRQTQLLTELTRLEAQKIGAEARVSLLEKVETAEVSPEQVMAGRREFVNSDPLIQELSQSIVQLEQDLIASQLTLMPGNPNLTQRQALLDSFTQKLDERTKKLEEEYDGGLEDRLAESAQRQLVAAENELARIQAHHDRLREVLAEQDIQTRAVGRTNLDIQDRQYQVQIDQEMYDQISRRIKWLDMEREQDPRVELAYMADLQSEADKRGKYSIATVFAALACGMGMALLRDKLDKRLQTPDDVSRHLDLPVLGTTTSSRTVKAALFADQIAGDYQTIRTNLGLLNGGIPKRLVVSSAGMREGKTTFAVNLATSLAKSGKKVLLIDGDLRKPDIGYMLNLSNGSAGLQDVLLGEDPSGIVSVLPASGLHVLVANPRHLGDAYELLTSATAAEQVERLSRDYDHIVIDSPPTLAFPDALVWARLTDAVVLVGFAGQTTAPELNEAKERFLRMRARVLGAVLSNVPADLSLYRYAQSYKAKTAARSARKASKPRRLLLATQDSDDSTPTT